MNLLHLVSEQTMQNLLPILALRPTKVIQVRSRAEKFRKAELHLKQAVESMRKQAVYADLNPEFFDFVINEESPLRQPVPAKSRRGRIHRSGCFSARCSSQIGPDRRRHRRTLHVP